MNRELITAIEQIGREKGIGREVLFEALESALLSASKKTMGSGDNVRMHLDRQTGQLRVFCRKKVVKKVFDSKTEISVADAKALKPDADVGDEIEIELEPREFGRIAAQTAKQVILQRVREAERDGIFDEFHGKEGQIVRGVVHRIEKRNVIVELGKAEGIIPEREQIPGERYGPGDRIRAYVYEVKKTAKGPQIGLSRTHPGFLTRLFETEIPEIAEGIVQAAGHYGKADLSRYTAMLAEGLRYLLPEFRDGRAPDAAAAEDAASRPPEPVREPEDDSETKVLEIVAVLDKDGKGAPWDGILEAAKAKGVGREQLEEAINGLLDKGLLYEPVLGRMKKI